MTNPDISIIVCTHNRAPMLRSALASLGDLATDSLFTYEIVVIDNASTDPTPQMIEEAAAASKTPLRAVREPQQGIVPARNRGIHEARGRWIAFFDDDQLADPGWLVELYRGAQQKQCRVVGGAVHLALHGLSSAHSRPLDPTVRMLLGEAIHSDQPLAYSGRITPGCGNLMIERSIFDEIGVFEKCIDGRGEDTDLFARIQRAGIDAWYLPTAIVHHIAPPERLTEAYLLTLARRMGDGIARRQAAQLHPAKFAVLWLAKAARAFLIYCPLLALARLTGDQERALGQRCLLAITTAFLSVGGRSLWPRRRSAKVHSPNSAPAALVPGITSK